MGLAFSMNNFFINKIALANIWMSFSCIYLALAGSNYPWKMGQIFVAFSEYLNFNRRMAGSLRFEQP
jgi:hypothetical protein